MNSNCSSKTLRQIPLLLRNDFATEGKYGMPKIRKQSLDVNRLDLQPADKVCKQASEQDVCKTVHFFIDDIKIDKYYNHPEKYLDRLAQYAGVFTPDYSLYSDMPIAIQIINTFRNRWCGAYWQDCGIKVIPTVSWGIADSFDFCFDGIEYGSIIAISTVGNRVERISKKPFIDGYHEMIRRISPERVLCLGKAFPEMGEEVYEINYKKTRGIK